MAYIGNTVENQGFTPAIDYFNGNGVTVTFTLSRPIASVAQVIVAIDNVIQNPSSSFTVAGNAITFSSAPLSGTNNIWVEYTSLITTYQGISQDPTVIGDIRATGGYLAEGDFGNSFVAGAILDYVTGLGRITVGSAEGIALYNGGTASRTALMTVAATGNVGIGTTTPNSFSDPANNLVVGTTSGNNGITIVGGTTGLSSIYLADGTTGNEAYRGYLEYGHTSDYMALGTAASERMRIDSSGNVGIGTTSPSAKLHVDGTGNQYTRVSSSTHSNFIQAGCVSGSTFHEYKSVYRLVDTDAGERMRIDSSGNVIMGNTSYDYSVNGFGFGAGNGYSYFTRTSGYALLINRKTTTGAMQVFNYNNSGVGDISTNGSNCTFNSTSDYRLKQNVQPMTGALARVNLLKPVTYNWIRENQAGEGFIAHELQEVVPEAVTGTKDAVDEDGNPVYQAIDQSVLVATLTAAIQEQQTLITSLTARIAALEAK